MEEYPFDVFSDVLVMAWRYAKSYKYKCCCPGCNENAIKSHLLQQHPLLASICDEKNCLLQMKDNDNDPRSGEWDFYNRRKVGISNALQYKLFCKKHDNSLFKELEKQNSIPNSKRDCLLLAFRSGCAVRHQEEHRLHIYESQKKSTGIEYPLESISHIFIRRMDGVVNNLWAAINNEGDGNYLFRMISMPRIDIAASDCIIDEADLEKHIMDDNYVEPLNSLFVNLIPHEDKTYLLLGCDTQYDKNGEYTAIIEQFPTGDVTSDYLQNTIKGILLKCSNWCCSPELYEDNSWKVFFDEYENLKVASQIN